MSAKPLTTAEAIPEDWPGIIRDIVQRDGYAIRAKADAASIEVKSLRTNKWLVLCLPGGGFSFLSNIERDIILSAIVNPKQVDNNPTA